MSDTHECEAEGCTSRVPHQMLMCRRHWFMVPKPTRDELWAAYRNLRSDVPRYRLARKACIDAVKAKEGRADANP